MKIFNSNGTLNIMTNKHYNNLQYLKYKEMQNENHIEQADEEIKRLHSIIKEVREYIEEKEKNDDNWVDYELLIEPIRIKEILDKEVN